MKVSMIQMDIIHKSPKENREKIKQLVADAMKDNPDLIILPETCTTGFTKSVFENIDLYLENEEGETISLFKDLAKKHSINIVTGSIPEKYGRKCYNTVFYINREGKILSKYRKIHLFTPANEDAAFENGERMPVFETEFGKIAMMTCYDIRFVELSRIYALSGADIIIIVANFPNPKVNHWRTLIQARAIENQLYIFACNRVGEVEKDSYFGHSLVVDPWGDIVVEGDDSEKVISTNINLKKINEVRNIVPMYVDRQTKAYKKHIEKLL